MSVYKVLLTAIITGEELVEAESPEEAKAIALNRFEPTGEAPQTFEKEAAIADELAPVRDKLIRGYLPNELCAYHDYPKVYVGGRMKCELCEGAYAGND